MSTFFESTDPAAHQNAIDLANEQGGVVQERNEHNVFLGYEVIVADTPKAAPKTRAKAKEETVVEVPAEEPAADE